ncbi:MAG: LysM peptidoglycan-binding domain-containing protein [Anaerolineales bacterium]|nr:LysM peptidoglycan-binding domain-containing protein [Anaerolineales bacterium]
MAKTTSDQINTCPFLGLNNDNTSHMAFTSPENCCHHCKPIVPIKLEHQNDYCLDTNFLTCPVYTDQEGRRMPPDLIYSEKAGSMRIGRRLLWAGLILAGIAAATLLFFMFENAEQSGNSPSNLISINSIQTLTAIANSSSLPTSTAALTATDSINIISNTETAFPAITATVSPFPTLTLTSPTSNVTQTNTAPVSPSLTASPTSMQTPSPHSLDVPVGRGQLFIIHKVINGENLSTLADTHSTSLEAIMAVNYQLNVPIKIDAVIIIPLQKKDTQGLSIFEPYQVTATQITAEALANELDTDSLLFKYVNDLKDGDLLHQGDWILVPR